MKELLGKPVADAITASLAPDIERLASVNARPTLAIVRVGESGDDIAYERNILRRFEGANAGTRVITLGRDSSYVRLGDTLASLSRDPSVHGILMFRPLPAGFNSTEMEALIPPEKDVDGMSPLSFASVFAGRGAGYPPCTAEAVMELLSFYGIPLEGANVTIVGRSLVVGKPLAMLALGANATVTVCHTRTRSLPSVAARADILIACAGRAGMITKEFVKPGAVLVDVGINVVDGKLAGDVSPEAYPASSAYTPVPRGVGSVTTAVILKHTVLAAKRAVNIS